MNMAGARAPERLEAVSGADGRGRIPWPEWLTVRVPAGGPEPGVGGVLRDLRLHTVCEEAHCPNICDCFHRRTATFLVLGKRCTRGCRFCAVKTGKPEPLDAREPDRVAEAARRLRLSCVILTSVTRDDLTDGGAAHFAACIRAIRRALPRAAVEVLVPDFGGAAPAVRTVAMAGPDVFGHNVETVPRLYTRVRPGAGYRRSLRVLEAAAAAGRTVKSGLMLGLGETAEEVEGALKDLRQVGCSVVTLGQYLRPSERALPVERFVPPAEFDAFRALALSLGFSGVAAGPLVRSSYRAHELMAAATSAGGSTARPICRVRDLGRMAYPGYLDLQRRLVAERQAGESDDTLLLAEHDPVLTWGRDGGEDQVLVSREVLRRKGISIFAVDRGGSITFHGPGQLMIYPILDLRRHGSDVHLHLRRLEEAVIRTLGDWGIKGSRRSGLPGVWVGSAKIAAMGVAVAKGVTSHGAALNLDPDLDAFRLINPCGLPEAAATSVRAVAGAAPAREKAAIDFCRNFADVYGVHLRPSGGQAWP